MPDSFFPKPAQITGPFRERTPREEAELEAQLGTGAHAFRNVMDFLISAGGLPGGEDTTAARLGELASVVGPGAVGKIDDIVRAIFSKGLRREALINANLRHKPPIKLRRTSADVAQMEEYENALRQKGFLEHESPSTLQGLEPPPRSFKLPGKVVEPTSDELADSLAIIQRAEDIQRATKAGFSIGEIAKQLSLDHRIVRQEANPRVLKTPIRQEPLQRIPDTIKMTHPTAPQVTAVIGGRELPRELSNALEYAARHLSQAGEKFRVDPLSRMSDVVRRGAGPDAAKAYGTGNVTRIRGPLPQTIDLTLKEAGLPFRAVSSVDPKELAKHRIPTVEVQTQPAFARAVDIANKYGPGGTDAEKILQAAQVMQILGPNLRSPASRVMGHNIPQWIQDLSRAAGSSVRDIADPATLASLRKLGMKK